MVKEADERSEVNSAGGSRDATPPKRPDTHTQVLRGGWTEWMRLWCLLIYADKTHTHTQE
jgi:hypothetical protein